MKKYNQYILLILIIGLILRVISINQSLWIDEATSALTVKNLSFSQIINDFSLGDFHPPLYYLILKLWNNFFGNSETSLRSLSVIFGIASIYFTYLVGSVFGRKVGLLSALLLAVNGLHIYYSQEARMYSMSVFLVLALVFLFLKVLRSEKKIYWFLFSLFIILNFFTDYLPNLVILVFVLYVLIVRQDKSWWKKFIFSFIPLIILAFFWFPNLFQQLKLGYSVKESGNLWWKILGKTDLKNILLVPVKFIFGRISFFNKTLYLILSATVLSLYSLIIISGYKKMKNNKNYLLMILLVCIPLLISALLGIKVSVFSYFRLIFILPFFLIVIALSIMNLRKRWRILAVTIVLIVNVLSSLYYLLNPRFHREDWKGLASYIKNNSPKRYGIVFSSDGQYEGLRYYSDMDKVIKSQNVSSDDEVIWFVRYVWDIFDPQDKVKDKIESNGFVRKNIYDFNGIIVWKYENSN